LDLEEQQGLVKTKQTLESVRNNGGGGSKTRFYEKLSLLYRINLSRTLNCEIGAVDEVLSSVEKELQHFEREPRLD
jgi:hypothetical protein